MNTDRALIYAGAAIRGAAVSLSGILLGLHLATIGFGPSAIGLAIALGLGACAAATVMAIFQADRLGRRRSLAAIAFLMATGGLVLAFATHAAVVFAAILFGMVNGMGRDRGASLTIDQAMLPRVTTDAARTNTFARYNVAGDIGNASGALLAGLPALLRDHAGMPRHDAYQGAWILYAILSALTGIVILKLSPRVEPDGEPTTGLPRATEAASAMRPRLRLAPASRPIVARFAALSFLDSLGGGFLNSALISYWFFLRFGLDESFLAPFFFAVRVLNALSHLGAAWLARRFGLVNTMVFTHLPSSVLLMIVPGVGSPGPAVALFLLRESLVEMDVPTRQSYLAAVVPDRDRTPAAGITNLVRSTGWAVAPAVGGALMSSVSISAPLVGGAVLKIVYDLLLYRAFRHLKPPEEQGRLLVESPPNRGGA